MIFSRHLGRLVWKHVGHRPSKSGFLPYRICQKRFCFVPHIDRIISNLTFNCFFCRFFTTQVIRYQKQLQQNYIHMYRRNRDLERVMRELSLELENRDTEDYEVHSGSNDIHFEEITATEIWTQTHKHTLHPGVCTERWNSDSHEPLNTKHRSQG